MCVLLWLRAARSSFATACAGVALLAASGCTDDTEAPPPAQRYCDVVECSERCRSLEFEACSIERAECQALVQQAVECVRGIRFEDTPVVRVTRVSSELDDPDAGTEVTNLDSSAPATRSMPLTVPRAELPQPEEIADYHATKALQALGLLSPEATITQAWSEAATNIAGTYDTMDQVLEVLVPEDRAPWSQMSILAHEMVHALQDQELNLNEWREQKWNDGASPQAVRAFVEGEAELYQLLAMHFMLDIAFSESRLEELTRWSTKAVMRSIDESESPIAASQFGVVYPIGAKLHLKHWSKRGIRGTESLADSMPLDLAAWLRVDDESTEVRLTCDDVEAGSDAGPGIFGFQAGAEYLLPLLLKRLRHEEDALAYPLAMEAASAWRGDCFEIYGEAFEPGAPTPDEERLLTGPPRAANQMDAGAAPLDGLADDAGLADAGAAPPEVWARRSDVRLRWTIEFDTERIAQDVTDALLLPGWPEEWPPVNVAAERNGRVVVFELATDQLPAQNDPLVDCWPLYPFDPKEMYVSWDGKGIAHWTEPERTLGAVFRLGGKMQIRVDGELLLLDEYLFTPDWCHYPDEPYPDPRWGKENDVRIPHPCDPGHLTTVPSVTGDDVYRCGNPGDWLSQDGSVIVPDGFGEVLSAGYSNTLLLSEGIFRYNDDALAELVDDAAAIEDAGAEHDGGLQGEVSELSQRLTVVSSGVYLEFDDPVPSLNADILAVRALPDGYWVLTRHSRGGESVHSLWHVDFYGRPQLVIEYDLPDYVVTSGKIDGYGTVFLHATHNASYEMWRVTLDGRLHRSGPVGTFVTGP